MLLSNPQDTAAEPLRSRVRYMDCESIWLDEPEGAWRPRRGAAVALQSETRGIRYETTVPFRERTADPQTLWRLDRPADDAIERSAARADMRQKVGISGAAVEVFGETGEFQHGKRFPVTVVDLSAGGVLLESAIEIPDRAELEHMLTFPLPHEHESLRVDVRLLQSIRIERSGNSRYRYRVRLVRPTSGVTNQIARYVFDVDAAGRGRCARGGTLSGQTRASTACSGAKGSTGVHRRAPCLAQRQGALARRHAPGRGDRSAHHLARSRRAGGRDGTAIRWELALPREFRQRIGRRACALANRHHGRTGGGGGRRGGSAQAGTQRRDDRKPERRRRRLPIGDRAAYQSNVGPQSALQPARGFRALFRPPADRGGQRRRMGERTVFLYRSQFRNLTEPEREEITRQIYRLQTEQRREERDAAS